MERKLLYNLIIDSYIGPQFYNFNEVYNYNFNKIIDFDNCYDIILKIQKNILNNIFEIKIDNCKFIDFIKINTFNDPNDSSKVTIYKKNIHIDINIFFNHINFNILRYSLYIVYYNFLKQTNCNHIFVLFIDYISKINFNNIELVNNSNSFSEYVKCNINLLKKEKQNIINETIFYNIIDFGAKLKNEWNKKEISIE